jgi:hypothetical protein
MLGPVLPIPLIFANFGRIPKLRGSGRQVGSRHYSLGVMLAAMVVLALLHLLGVI